jgi:phosphopantetheinyl transferase (holo-ACP synthase)
MSKQVKQKISPNGTRSQETAANVYSLPSIAQVIKYQHAAAGFPIKETWLKAIVCGYYASWPGVTATNVKKYCPKYVETQKGHMKKQRQNVQLMKVRITDDDNDDIELDRTLKKHNIMVKVIHAHNTTTPTKLVTSQFNQAAATSC